MQVGDVTGDQIPDVILSGWDPLSASNTKGNPHIIVVPINKFNNTISFAAQMAIPLPSRPEAVIMDMTLQRFDADKKLDLVLLVAHASQDTVLWYLEGTGNSSQPFKAAVEIQLKDIKLKPNYRQPRLSNNWVLPIPEQLSYMTPAFFTHKSNSTGIPGLALGALPYQTASMSQPKWSYVLLSNKLTKNIQLNDPRMGTRIFDEGTLTRKNLVPQLFFSGGQPNLGNSNFSVGVSNLPGGTIAALGLGPRWAKIKVHNVIVHIFPIFDIAKWVRITSGGGDADGVASFKFGIPNDRALLGRNIYTYSWAIDTKSNNGPIPIVSTKCGHFKVGEDPENVR